jgi:carbon monoxide dehydrogenase subunit G
MAAVTVERVVPRPIEAVWAIVSDLAGHRVPLTRIDTDPGPTHIGWGFVARTGVGRVRFADRMVVTRWQPPVDGAAEFAIVKTGRWLSGWASVRVVDIGAGETRLTWREEIVPHPYAVGRLIAPLTDRAVLAIFRQAVDDLAARA